ncbi:MAG: glycosyltransferase family 9 protein [Acidobacteria bacterium]|nr:glycosyltransferase family 9 protein [Acidobacteriota bacterium]
MKILLVRLRLIGDVVFTTPLVRALRRQHPGAHLTYVVEPLAAAVIRGNPHLDEILEVPRRRGLDRLRDDVAWGRLLRRRRFDVAIDLHGGPRSAWLTWASGAPLRIGYRTRGRSWMYTHPVPRPADLGPLHSVLKQWPLLAPLGVGACDPARDAVEMPADAAAEARVARWLAEAGIRDEHPMVVVHVSAGNPFRRWPAAHFTALVAELARRDPARRFVVTSGPSDAEAARAIVDAVRAADAQAGAAVRHVEFEPAELRALTARAAVYIGGDSGPLHIAATTTTPVVGLFGPTLAERSMPWRDRRLPAEAVDAGPLPCRPCRQRTCAPGDFRCLTRIDPARVVAAAERLLERARASGLRPQIETSSEAWALGPGA